MKLTKEQILASSDFRMDTVKVPEWGGEVMIRTMTSRDRDAWEAEAIATRQAGKVAPENARARYVARVLCDERGALLFSAEDVEALGQKNATALVRVFSAALELNSITAKDLEEIEKN